MKSIIKFILNAKTSWQTSIAGLIPSLLIIVTQIGYVTDNNPATVFSWTIFWGAISLIYMSFSAKDANKKSEDHL